MTTPGRTDPLPPYVPPAGDGQPRRGNGVGLAALIVGIVALLLAFLPIGSFVAFLPALAAIALGIVGLTLAGRSRGTSVAGLVLGGVALIVAIVISVISVIGLVGRTAGRLQSDFPAPLPSEVTATASPSLGPSSTASPGISLAPGAHTVVYTIRGSGTATVNYGTFAGGDSSSSAGRKLALPFRKTVAIHTTAGDSFASFTVGATQLDPADPVSCTITVDGHVVSSKKSDSTTLAFVFCSARTTF
jgi:hypothetical protein